MKKKVLVWVLAAVLLLSMVGCSAANVSSTNDQYVGMEPIFFLLKTKIRNIIPPNYQL